MLTFPKRQTRNQLKNTSDQRQIYSAICRLLRLGC